MSPSHRRNSRKQRAAFGTLVLEGACMRSWPSLRMILLGLVVSTAAHAQAGPATDTKLAAIEPSREVETHEWTSPYCLAWEDGRTFCSREAVGGAIACRPAFGEVFHPVACRRADEEVIRNLCSSWSDGCNGRHVRFDRKKGGIKILHIGTLALCPVFKERNGQTIWDGYKPNDYKCSQSWPAYFAECKPQLAFSGQRAVTCAERRSAYDASLPRTTTRPRPGPAR